MNAIMLLIGQLEEGAWTLVNAAQDLTDSDFYQRLPHGGESADWIFGHLATNEDWFLSVLTGSALTLPQSLRDVYLQDFPPASRPEESLGRDAMIAAFKKQRARVIEALRSQNGADWNNPAPAPFPSIFKTRGDIWGLLGTHQYWHIGQLMSIRTMLCMPAFQFPAHDVAAAATGSTAPPNQNKSDDLIIPQDGPRILPREMDQVNPYVRAEFDKAMETWGIHNNLVRTMGCHPDLALTEVDYANSFIFKENEYVEIPRPGAPSAGNVLFPAAGFIDRVTKELVITVVSLLNRSRYSITHHGVISFGVLSQQVSGNSPQEKSALAEAMLLHLVDSTGNATYRQAPPFDGKALYSEFQIAALSLAERTNRNAHALTDQEFVHLRELMEKEAASSIKTGPLAVQFGENGPDKAYLDAYVDGMLVELTWNIVHFSGLLNRWFTMLKVKDETFAVNPQGQNFIEVYNAVVPDSIKARNNSLLGPDGWGY